VRVNAKSDQIIWLFTFLGWNTELLVLALSGPSIYSIKEALNDKILRKVDSHILWLIRYTSSLVSYEFHF